MTINIPQHTHRGPEPQKMLSGGSGGRRFADEEGHVAVATDYTEAAMVMSIAANAAIRTFPPNWALRFPQDAPHPPHSPTFVA
jgi:hypothetical protein